MARTEFTISFNGRPCIIGETEALFYAVEIQTLMAIVELKCGHLKKVPIESIRLLDSKAQFEKHIWGSEVEPNGEKVW